MASQLGYFTLQQFSDAGTLLVGGRLYTYLAGSTTFKTAYTDAAGLVPHTYTNDGSGGQYIALNARGEIPAPLYGTTGSYDIALKRADGTTVWTRQADPIDTASSALAIQLANNASTTQGAGMVGWGPAVAYTTGIGSILRYFFGNASAEIAAGVTPTNYGYPPLDIRRYGGLGDATFNGTTWVGTDNSTAFSSAMKVACYWFSDTRAATVYIPSGSFLITQNNFLGQFDFTTFPTGANARYYFGVRGDGWGSCIIWQPTGNSPTNYMYDGGTTTTPKNNLVMPTFKGLNIFASVTGLSAGGVLNGFRINGRVGNAQQGFHFDQVRFSCVDYPGTNAQIIMAGELITIVGTVNADVTKATGCRVRGWKTLINGGSTNVESICHVFSACDVEVMYGDVITSGAGGVAMYGGSVVMMSEIAISYLLAIRPGNSFSQVGTFVLDGVRCEFDNSSGGTSLSRLFLLDSSGQIAAYNSTSPKIKFTNCNFLPFLGAPRTSIQIDASSKAVITFDNCDGMDLGNHLVNVNSSQAALATVATGPFTSLNFINGTAVPFANVTFTDTNSLAHISSRNCPNTLDYDLTANGNSESRSGRSIPLKTATIWGTSWPDVGNNTTMSLIFPKGSLMKAARFRKAANGGAATPNYRLAIVDGGANQFCASVIAVQNVEHKASADNLYITLDNALGYVANISDSQTLFLVATTGNTGSAQAVAMGKTDYAMVDYF